MNEQTQVPGVMLYRHCYEAFQGLSHETVGILTMALMEYAFFAVVPDLPPELQIAWSFLKNYADRDGERYALKVTHRRAAAEKRWEKEERKEPSSPPLASTSAASWPHPRGGCRGEAVTGGAAARLAQAPSVTAFGGDTSPKGGGKDDTTPPPKNKEKTFGNIEWMEQHVYRDEKGVIRYR